MLRVLLLVLLFSTVAITAAAQSPVETLASAFTTTIQKRQPAAFDGILADDFTGYVGGWGPTTCVTYNKTGFIHHVAAWQSDA